MTKSAPTSIMMSPPPPPPYQPDQWSIELAARTVWGEAEGEGLIGQAAVAWVVWNRLRIYRWGGTLAEVCLAPAQFSCWLDHSPRRPKILQLAIDDKLLIKLRILVGEIGRQHSIDDPTGSATFYHAEGIAPIWTRPPAQMTVHIGHHLFWKGVR